MGDWRFVLVNSNDGSGIAGLGAANTRKITWALDDAASASFSIPGTHPPAASIIETETDLKVYDTNGTLRFRGRIGASTDDVSDSGHVVQCSAVDYRGFLQRRIIWPGSTLTFTSEEQTQIAWQLIQDTQATTGGDLGITLGTSNITGVFRSETYQEGAGVGQTITTLADTDQGFDWEIDENLRFNTYFPFRGVAPGITLSYGAQILSFKRTLDTSNYANAVRYSGDTSLTAVTEEASSFGAAGRWELQAGNTDITDAGLLTATAVWELGKDQEINPTYKVVLRPGWWTPDVLWLGDIATLVLKSGRLDIFAQYRVITVEVDLGDDGGETVTLTFGGPGLIPPQLAPPGSPDPAADPPASFLAAATKQAAFDKDQDQAILKQKVDILNRR